jgi:uncharacterized membrane protein YkgB
VNVEQREWQYCGTFSHSAVHGVVPHIVTVSALCNSKLILTGQVSSEVFFVLYEAVFVYLITIMVDTYIVNVRSTCFYSSTYSKLCKKTYTAACRRVLSSNPL